MLGHLMSEIARPLAVVMFAFVILASRRSRRDQLKQLETPFTWPGLAYLPLGMVAALTLYSAFRALLPTRPTHLYDYEFLTVAVAAVAALQVKRAAASDATPDRPGSRAEVLGRMFVIISALTLASLGWEQAADPSGSPATAAIAFAGATVSILIAFRLTHAQIMDVFKGEPWRRMAE